MRSTSYQHFYRVHCWLSTRYNEWFSTELNASKSTLLPPRKSKYWSLVPFPRKKKIIWIPKENHRRIQCSSVASSRFLLQNLRVTLFLLVGFLYACLYWQVFRLRPDKKAPANGNDGNGNIWCIDSVCWCDSAEISSLRWKNGNEAMDYVENYSLKQEICTLSTFKWNKTWIIGSISDFSYAIWKNWKVQSIWTFCTKIILSNKKYTEKNISVKQKFLFYPKEFKPSIGWNELLLF